jgi:STE24 endopeptidase
MAAHRVSVPLAVAVTVVAAGVATLALRPRNGLIVPSAVDATAYFSPEELDRARDYRGPQRILALAGLGATGLALALVALRPPRRLRRALERAGARPLLGGAAAGAGLSLVLAVVVLPLEAVAHERSVDVGLSTQGWGEWAGDQAKATGIAAAFAAGGGALALGLARRFPRNWWAPGGAAVVAVSAGFVFLSPVVLEPLFNKFEPLPRGPLRAEVLELAGRSDVDVGEVYRVDASRRTTGANAYVGGLGGTKRVVLYDNLIEDFAPDQVRAVVAHELSHVKNRDLPRGLLWLAIVALPGALLIQRLTEGIGRRRGAEPGTPAMLPGLALSVAVVAFPLGLAGNALSRDVENRADAYALDLTRDAAAQIELERRLTVQNVSDPDPPELLHTLFGTHPTTLERIGSARTWARQH